MGSEITKLATECRSHSAPVARPREIIQAIITEFNPFAPSSSASGSNTVQRETHEADIPRQQADGLEMQPLPAGEQNMTQDEMTPQIASDWNMSKQMPPQPAGEQNVTPEQMSPQSAWGRDMSPELTQSGELEMSAQPAKMSDTPPQSVETAGTPSEATEGSYSSPKAAEGAQTPAGAAGGAQTPPGAAGGAQTPPGAAGGAHAAPEAAGGAYAAPAGGAHAAPDDDEAAHIPLQARRTARYLRLGVIARLTFGNFRERTIANLIATIELTYPFMDEDDFIAVWDNSPPLRKMIARILDSILPPHIIDVIEQGGISLQEILQLIINGRDWIDELYMELDRMADERDRNNNL